MKKGSRRIISDDGFTLIELIVILIILAVLAAILVPVLTGYINKSKAASLIESTQQIKIAAQSQYTQAYADGHVKQKTNLKVGEEQGYYIQFEKKGFTYKSFVNSIKKLAEMKDGSFALVAFNERKMGEIEGIEFFDGHNGCSYYNNNYIISEADDNEYYPLITSLQDIKYLIASIKEPKFTNNPDDAKIKTVIIQ